MSNLNKFKVAAAGLALVVGVGTAQAQSARDIARRDRSPEAATQPASSASANGLSARDACKQLATTDFTELPATGKGFATGGDLACEFTRVGQAYTVSRTYDLTNPAQAQAFDRSIQTANRLEQVAQQRQAVQQQRDDRQNSPLNQAREVMRDAQQGTNILRQGQNLFRGFGIK